MCVPHVSEARECVCGFGKVRAKAGPEPAPEFKSIVPALDPGQIRVFGGVMCIQLGWGSLKKRTQNYE